MTDYEKTGAVLDRILTLELVRVTERAAVAAARFRGRGDEKAADQAAVDAMRQELNQISIHGTVVIGEGERDEAPMLYIGEEVGTKDGPRVDIALDPLEGTTICAKNLPNALAVLAVSESGGLLNAPDSYMNKIAIGPGFEPGLVDLDRTPTENMTALANAKGVAVSEITACVLDRPRHTNIIEEIRSTGAALRLIGDGDVAGVIHTTDPEETGIDIYMGIGGAPEGVLAAAALQCIGGQMQGRLVFTHEDQKFRAQRMGIENIEKKFEIEDMATGDIYFSATGVTDGNFLQGVKFAKEKIVTHTIVMRSTTETVRFIKGVHTQSNKFRNRD